MLCAANYVYQQCSAKDKPKENFIKKTNGNNWKLGLEEMTKEGRQIKKSVQSQEIAEIKRKWNDPKGNQERLKELI